MIIGPLGAVLRVEPQQEGTTVAWSRSHPQGTRGAPRATVKLPPELEMVWSVHTLGYIPALPCAHLHSETLQLDNEGDPRRVTLSWDAAA